MAKNQRKGRNNKAHNPQNRQEDRLEQALQNLVKEMAQLTAPQRQILERQQRLEERQQRLEERQLRLEERQECLEERQQRLEGRQQRLEEIVAQLVEGQRQLQEGQQRFQEAVVALMEADRRMMGMIRELNRRVGRIETIWSFSVEAAVQVLLASYLAKHMDIHLRGEPGEELQPMFMTIKGEEQVDLYGEGARNGKETFVVCECKSRTYDRDAKAFVGKSERIKPFLKKQVMPVSFASLIHPSAYFLAGEHSVVFVRALQQSRGKSA